MSKNENELKTFTFKQEIYFNPEDWYIFYVGVGNEYIYFDIDKYSNRNCDGYIRFLFKDDDGENKISISDNYGGFQKGGEIFINMEESEEVEKIFSFLNSLLKRYKEKVGNAISTAERMIK